jgi:putative peptide zinc metalloprotease protein
MRPLRSIAIGWIAALVAVVGLSAPAWAQQESGNLEDNTALAINTTDGATVFRVAFSIRTVADGTVDQTNTAAALARCTDCQTVALAFQIVLVRGDADIATPENRAIAINDQCDTCLTYASATQIVLSISDGAHLTGEGQQRLRDLQVQLAELEGQIGDMTVAELDAVVQAAKQELIAILQEELVDHPTGEGDATTTSSSSTSTTPTVTAPSSTTSATTDTTIVTVTTSEVDTTTTTETVP